MGAQRWRAPSRSAPPARRSATGRRSRAAAASAGCGGGRYRYAERLCGTQVENGFELVCLLDGEVEGIDALEDLVDEHGRATAHFELVRTVPDQASGFGDLARSRQRERLPCRKIGNRSRVAEKYCVLLNHGRIDAGFGHGQKSRFEIIPPVRVEALQADLQRAAGSLERRERQSEKGIIRFDEDSRLRDVRHGLLEQLEPFRHELGQEIARAGDVPPWLPEAGDDPGGNGVADIQDDDWNRRGCMLRRKRSRSPVGHDDVDVLTDKFSRERRELVVFSSAQRNSMTMFLPSTYPRSRRPERNAS